MYRIDHRYEPPQSLMSSYVAQYNGVTYYSGFNETLLESLNVKLSYAVARCEHGYTRNQYCNDCDAGYVYDTHTFANFRAKPLYALPSDDGFDVAYISKRYAAKLRKLGYE